MPRSTTQSEPDFSKGLPAAIESEKFILGAVLRNQRSVPSDENSPLVYEQIRAELRADEFHFELHRIAWGVFDNLWARDFHTFDYLTLATELQSGGHNEMPPSYWMELTDIPDIVNLAFHVAKVKTAAHRNRGIKKAQEITTRLLRDDEDAAKVIASGAEFYRELENDNNGGRLPEGGTLITRRVAEVEARPIRWLWPYRIPRGKLTIIAGHPGLGKSQITAYLAALVTKGGSWPAGGGQAAGGGQVVILTAEDDTRDTLRPRLEAAGADIDRVHTVDGVIRGHSGDGTLHQRMFSLESDLAALDRKLTELKRVELVIIDPISAYLGKIDSHNNAEVRGALGPVKELAERHGAAFVAVSHMNKAGGTQALLRVTGSLAFIAAARAGYLVAPDPQADGRKLFLPLKSNLAKQQAGLTFYFEEVHFDSPEGEIETSRVVWSDLPVTITADEVMSQTTPEESSALREAQDWLRQALKDGPVGAKDIQKQAKDNGIAASTLRRARESLSVKTTKQPGEKGVWVWELAQVPGTHNMGKLSNLDKLTDEKA